MVRIGRTILGKRPAIALTITDRETPDEIRRVQLTVGARRAVPLLLEIRIDRFRSLDSDSVLQKIRRLKATRLPLIATIRSFKEGGARRLSDSARLELFTKVLPLVEAIDLELASKALGKALIPLARRRGKRVILSYHNFKFTPSDGALTRLVREGKRAGADWVKVAVTPRKRHDVARLLRFTQKNRNKHLISLAMGRLGKPSRVLAPFFGSLLTYSSLKYPQAPGQIPVQRLLEEWKPFLS